MSTSPAERAFRVGEDEVAGCGSCRHVFSGRQTPAIHFPPPTVPSGLRLSAGVTKWGAGMTRLGRPARLHRHNRRHIAGGKSHYLSRLMGIQRWSPVLILILRANQPIRSFISVNHGSAALIVADHPEHKALVELLFVRAELKIDGYFRHGGCTVLNSGNGRVNEGYVLQKASDLSGTVVDRTLIVIDRQVGHAPKVAGIPGPQYFHYRRFRLIRIQGGSNLVGQWDWIIANRSSCPLFQTVVEFLGSCRVFRESLPRLPQKTVAAQISEPVLSPRALRTSAMFPNSDQHFAFTRRLP